MLKRNITCAIATAAKLHQNRLTKLSRRPARPHRFRLLRGRNLPWTSLVAPSTQRYIVAAIDYTSKFAAIHSCADITSPSVMQWLNNLFSEFGLPHQIVTDNRRQLVSEKFETFLTDRHSSYPYDPISSRI